MTVNCLKIVATKKVIKIEQLLNAVIPNVLRFANVVADAEHLELIELVVQTYLFRKRCLSDARFTCNDCHSMLIEKL